jgi:arginine deiminase
MLPPGGAVRGGAAQGNLGGIVSYGIGTDSEIGFLRTVLVHRPGLELTRITPRTRVRLRFDGQPWLARAQEEHDALTDVLRDRGAEVLYVSGLLQDVLEYESARNQAISAVLADASLGDILGASLREHLEDCAPQDLAAVLVAGLTAAELKSGNGLVHDLLDPHDFVIDPLPNLVFTRDSSVFIGDQAVVGSLPGPRRRENELMSVIYGHHPRFAGLRSRYEAGGTQLDGGDMLLLGPGVVAIGVGVRTTPASAERLAKHLLDTGVAHTVLAVPMNQRGDGGHLDRACTVVGPGVVIMVPALAFTLTALCITQRCDTLRVSRPRPFLEAAAEALGISRLTVIDTGVDPQRGGRGQWDDGGNALALTPAVAVCNERNVETNARLTAAGFEVVTVPGSELGGIRGGPRGMCGPVHRDPAIVKDAQASAESGQPAEARRREPILLDGSPVPAPAEPSADSARRELTPMG